MKIMKMRIPPKAWVYDYYGRNIFNEWSYIFTNRSVIETASQIVKKSSKYIKPISFLFKICVGETEDESECGKDIIFNNPESYTDNELVQLYKSILTTIKGPDEKKYVICSLYCQAFLTFYKENKLVSEWVPSKDFIKKELAEFDTRIAISGPITINIFQDYISVATITDIWIPRFRDDKLAVINGERLTYILRNIEKIVKPTKIYFDGKTETSDKYGFKKPEEIFQK